MPRLLPLDNREPSSEAAQLSPEAAQFQLWLAQAQRDMRSISDREMAKMEGTASILASRARVLWNPFTGEFRTAEIAQHYKSGDYLRIDDERQTTRLISGG